MSLPNRPLARFGAAGLLAAGALATFGAPAHAAGTETDLSLEVVGTRVTTTAGAKLAFAKVRNLGPNTPSELTIGIGLANIDHDQFSVVPLDQDNCAPDAKKDAVLGWSCIVPKDQLPKPGETLEYPLVVLSLTEPKAYSGEVQFAISSKDDTNKANNVKSTTLEFTAEHGVDISVLAPDVDRRIKPEEWNSDPAKAPKLQPGDETIADAYIFNQGDKIADGLDFKVTLPKGVTFSRALKECDFSADGRTADCTASRIRLEPGQQVRGVFPVKVAAGVKAPVSLTGGKVTASARGELATTDKSLAGGKGTLPSFLKEVPAAAKPTDVDPSDNSDDFAVVVAAKPNGGGGSGSGDNGTGDNGAGGTGGGNGDDDGGLPVTGPQAGLFGAVGLAAAAAGGALYLSARRRRVVLVTPGDEKTTS